MQWLFDRFSEFDQQPAFIRKDYSLTYGDVLSEIGRYSELFAGDGIIRGDVVVLVGPSDENLFSAVLAGMAMGCIIAPLTFQAPLTTKQAVEISGADWRCDVLEKSTKSVRSDIDVSIYPRLITELRSEAKGGLVLFSSGSTGQAKGILYENDKLLEKFRARRNPLKALSFLSLDHFGGLNTVLSILSSGGEVIVLNDRNVETVCAAIEKHRIRILPVTPTFIRLLLASGAHHRYDLSSLEKITFGTEPMNQGTLNRVRQEFPDVDLQQTYGLSEVGVLRSKSRPDGSLWMKVGGEGFDWRVKNGTLWVRSSYRMRGYLNAEAEFDDEGFFNTQDEVLVDGEYIQILGRKTDLINIGGEKIYPTAVEAIVIALENIVDVVAYGVPNAILGQSLAVDVVLESSENLADLRQRIRSKCREELGRVGVPAYVHIVDRVEVSARQKTIRPSVIR